MVRLDNCHRCRAEPFEATIYSLVTTGTALDTFRANFQAGLTIELEDTASTSKEKPEKAKTEQSSLELPLDFSRDDLKNVNLDSLPRSFFGRAFAPRWSVVTTPQKFALFL